MHPKIKSILQYLVAVLIAGGLLWLSVSNISTHDGQSQWEFIGSVFTKADIFFLVISSLLAIISHLIRALRWKMLINPLGYSFTLKESFLSVMIGYFVNLAIPRGGELSRCYNLYKLKGIPIDQSFGTVVAERIIDMILLVTMILVAFLIEFDKLWSFFEQLDYSTESSNGFQNLIIVGGGLLVFSVILIGYLILKRKILLLRLLSKIKSTLIGLKKGLKTIFQLDNAPLFYFYSLSIWVLYFLMSYFVVLAFPETHNLGMVATLGIFTIGGIAMAIPLPGGTGSYHVLVPLGLVVLYNIPKDESVAFSFIFLGWQTITVIIVGVISLLWSQFLIRKKAKSEKISN